MVGRRLGPAALLACGLAWALTVQTTAAQQGPERALASRVAGGPVQPAFGGQEQRREGRANAPGVRRLRFFEDPRGGQLYAVAEHVDRRGRATLSAAMVRACTHAVGARVVDWRFGPGLAVVEVTCPLERVHVYFHADPERGLREVLSHPIRARHVQRAEAHWDAAHRELRVVTQPRIPANDPHAGHLRPEPEVARYRWTGNALRPLD